MAEHTPPIDDPADETDRVEDMELDADAAEDVKGGYRGRYALKMDQASGQTQPPPAK